MAINEEAVLTVLENCANDLHNEMGKAAHTVLGNQEGFKIPPGWYSDALEGEINRSVSQNKPKYDATNQSFHISLSVPADEQKPHIEAMMEVLDDGNRHRGN